MKDLLQAQLFSGFPSWKGVAFKKELTPKILQFEITEKEEVSRSLYLASIISKEEKMAWQSFQDVLDHTMGFCAKRVCADFLDSMSSPWISRPGYGTSAQTILVSL